MALRIFPKHRGLAFVLHSDHFLNPADPRRGCKKTVKSANSLPLKRAIPIQPTLLAAEEMSALIQDDTP